MRYDYSCICGWQGELNVPVEERNDQFCFECGEKLLKDVTVPPIHFRADGFVTTEERKLKRKIKNNELHPVKDKSIIKKREASVRQIRKEKASFREE